MGGGAIAGIIIAVLVILVGGMGCNDVGIDLTHRFDPSFLPRSLTDTFPMADIPLLADPC